MQPPLRIAVLECDTPVGWAGKNYGTFGALFQELLEAGARRYGEQQGVAPPTLDITHWDVVSAQQYPNPDDVDAVLLTGAHYDAFDHIPWIAKLVDYTQKLLEQQRVKVIGVCFGHQIIGRALGARVGRNGDQWEVSVTDVELTKKGKEVFGIDTLAIHQMHRDIVFDVPEGVELLGSTGPCKVQGLYKKNSLMSTQGHPEFRKEIGNDLINARLKPGHAQYDDGMARVSNEHDGVAVSAAFIKFVIGK